MNSDALYSSPDAWEFSPVPAEGIDLQKDPSGGQKHPGSCARWVEMLTTGTLVFVTATGRQVTFTNVPAGRVYPIQIAKIVSAPGGVRVGW